LITPLIPTPKTPTAGLIVRFLSEGTPESSKRLIAAVCASVLCLLAVVLAEAIAFQAAQNWTVSSALVTAFVSVVGFIAALAREIFRKPDDKSKPQDPNPGAEG
jgi:hypothetical protein